MWQRWPDEARVMARPREAYLELSARPAPTLAVAIARGPLRMAVALGAAVAFLNGGHLSPARLLPAIACWSFVPALRIASLAVAAAVLSGRGRLDARAIGLYGAGQGPWYVWLLALSLVAVLDPAFRPSLMLPRREDLAFAVALAAVAAWSVAVRVAFFRVALGLSPARARAAVVLTAGLFWSAIAAWWLLSGQLLPRLIP